jgi:hypothetical protein
VLKKTSNRANLLLLDPERLARILVELDEWKMQR